ncbi:MAG TPA: FHA domain-containing protein [Candidatus Thermoplasmatota archaeon]|nr:FHA domain-containing protein [Candidatus Thermoplasmatota archaeon]
MTPLHAMPASPAERLAEGLAALASPTRICLVQALRAPRILSQIVVRPDAGPATGRPLARQTVARILGSLVASGIVVERASPRGHGTGTEFVVDHQRIFSLAEDLRGLARLRPTVEPQAETLPAGGPASPRRPGPQLVLVRGLDEGAAFPLDAGARSRWVVGRRRGCDVPLDFDASVSAENAVVALEDGVHWLTDVEGSLNGTSHNFRRLSPRERVPLRHGDVVGVGRSLLLFWS